MPFLSLHSSFLAGVSSPGSHCAGSVRGSPAATLGHAGPTPVPAAGYCLIAHEKKAYFWLETPEAADFSVSKQFQGH